MQRGKEKGEVRLSSPGLASWLEQGSGRDEGGLGEVFQGYFRHFISQGSPVKLS